MPLKMIARIFLALMPLIFALNLEAKLSFSNLEGQKDFLNSLYNEFEKLKSQKPKSDNDDDKEKNKEIDKYKEDIMTLKKTLINIEDATNQKDANGKILKELVDDYNKKMEELEKNYKFFLSKSKKAAPDEGYLSSKTPGVQTMDYLRHNNKRRKIGDTKFQPLEIIEIDNSASKIEENKMPLEKQE